MTLVSVRQPALYSILLLPFQLAPTEDDPALLSELGNLLTVAGASKSPTPSTSKRLSPSSNDGVALDTIQTRLVEYKSLIEVLESAQPVDRGRIRRYSRTVEQLELLFAQASRGKVVKTEELPPPPPAQAPGMTTPAVKIDASPVAVSAPICLFQLAAVNQRNQLAPIKNHI